MEINHLEKFKIHIKLACERLNWEFAPDAERQKDWGDDLGYESFFFQIDNIGYFVSEISNLKPNSKTKYYAAVIVEHRGSRIEPPSEDEKQLGKDADLPEHLLNTILNAHFNERLNHISEEISYLGIDEDSVLREEGY